MKKFIKPIALIIAITSFGFLFFSENKLERENKITNYYYYNGEKFYLQERTDVVFLKFKNNVAEGAALNILSAYRQLDLRNANIKTDDDNFLKLNSKLTDEDYFNLISEMKTNENFENVNFAYSPKGIDDGKTFYGLNDYLILQFKKNMTGNEIDNINAGNGLEIIQRINVTGGETFLAKVREGSPLNAMEMSNRYFEEGYVNYSEPSLYATNVLCDTVNDPFFQQQWSLRNLGSNIPGNPPNIVADADMDVDSAWITTQGDSNIVVAIIDTGVDTLHPDIKRVIGYDFVNNDGNPNDDGNHGTACAGIVAATGNNLLGVAGVAHKCKIMPIKVINSSGNIPGYHVAAFGTIWAYQNGASVLSNSWGYVSGASSILYNAIQDAARYGRNGKGSLVCYASGNEDTSPMRFPAISDAEMVVVGGLTPCNKRKSPSDGCSGETWGACYGPTLDIVAPCVKIYTTDRTGAAGYATGDYFSTFNGTSSATPNTAGVCALMVSANGNLTRKEIESMISMSAEKVGGYSYATAKEYGTWNNEMGYGRINARLALMLVSNTIDKVKPDIYHDKPLLSSRDSLSRIVTAIIRDNKKVATGTNQPRLYYRINGGAYNFINASSVVLDTFKFTIPGQTQGASIDYYLAAQDTVTAANIATLPAGGSGINPPGSTPPVSFFNYKIGGYCYATSTTTPKLCLNNATSFDTINISGISGNILDIDVRVNLSNRDDGDIDLFLLKDAFQSELTTDNGASGDSYVNTIFDDEATIPITSGTTPFTGRFRPETPLTAFDGQQVNGQWILRYTDDAATGNNSTIDSWWVEITYSIVTGINQTIIIPSKYNLAQNYPNPFNPVTSIKYSIPEPGFVTLKVYDVTGRMLNTIVNGLKQPGNYEAIFDASTFSSGIYFYKIEAGDFKETKSMMLLK